MPVSSHSGRVRMSMTGTPEAASFASSALSMSTTSARAPKAARRRQQLSSRRGLEFPLKLKAACISSLAFFQAVHVEAVPGRADDQLVHAGARRQAGKVEDGLAEVLR